LRGISLCFVAPTQEALTLFFLRLQSCVLAGNRTERYGRPESASACPVSLTRWRRDAIARSVQAGNGFVLHVEYLGLRVDLRPALGVERSGRGHHRIVRTRLPDGVHHHVRFVVPGATRSEICDLDRGLAAMKVEVGAGFGELVESRDRFLEICDEVLFEVTAA